MLLESLSNTILSDSLKILFRNQAEKLRELLISHDANNFAKKNLKAVWEEKLENVHYEYVLDNFQLSSQDLLIIYEQTKNEFDFEKNIRYKIIENLRKWTDNKPDETTLNNLIDDYFKSLMLYYIYHHEGISHLNQNNKLDQILNLLNSSLNQKIRYKYFHSLNKNLSRNIDYFPDERLFTDKLIYFTDKEKVIIGKIKSALTGDFNRNALLVGAPASGKTILSLAIAINLCDQGYHLYFYQIKPQSVAEKLFDEMYDNDLPNFIFVFDNCHKNISFTNEIIDRFDNLKNSSCLFISRDIPPNIRCIEDYENEDFFKKFNERRFFIGFKDKNDFDQKVKGIVKNYREHFENEGLFYLEVGDINRVVSNCHKNLLTLYYNLIYWPQAKILSQVNKNLVLKNICNRYLQPENRQLLLKIATLYQYEIHFNPNSNEERDIEKLLGKGLLNYDDEFKSYYFYHSDFAKLLLLSFESDPNFKALHKDINSFSYNNIKSYIYEFELYPPNLEELFHILVRFESGIRIILKLLNEPQIRDKIISYYQRCGSIVKLMFILYRLQNINYKIVKEIVQKISDDVWLSKLDEFHISGLSYSLMCLNETYPEKAQSLIAKLNVQNIIKISKTANIVTISNALIEFNKILPKYKLGTKVLNAFELSFLIKKLNKARFEHIGKSLSEFRRINSHITEKLYLHLEINRAIENAKKVGLKAIGKTLNELKTLEKELRIKKPIKSKIILNSIPNDLLLSKTEKVSFEGLGRALNELNNIDYFKIKSVFRNIDTNIILSAIQNVKLHQIGHTLSELKKVDAQKTREIFLQCDTKYLAYRITDQSLSIQQIAYALHQFSKIDKSNNKVEEIISKVQIDYFVKKFKQADFLRFCIALYYINAVNNDLIQKVLNKIPFDHIFDKAKREKFENLGSCLNKLYSIRREYSVKILDNLYWAKIIRKGPTVRFDKFGDSINNLFIIDNDKVTKIYRSIDFEFILNIAKTSGKSELMQGLSKLSVIDPVLTERIKLAVV